ncbi:LysR family transcriptional regulator [Actinosynnema sp. NPDC050436]|uniref:LysR family transcriptional regulator n=1 Tax=Actinosynnema sp. NPDC050436 TaxID=3155659 RepID=UPI0033CE15AA
MDLDAVRTFVAVVDAGRFQRAAEDLAVSQQAVSKRVAALERELGVRLLTRTASGARPTADGEAFLPHARELLAAARRAVAAVRPGRRPLRVDVIGRRLAPADLLRDFHRAHPEVELRAVTLHDADAAVDALLSGTVDASFRAVTKPPEGIAAARVLDEPIRLLTGPRHEFADAGAVTPADLAGHRIWMPGVAPGTEWGAFYEEFAAAFGFTLDPVGPHGGTEPLLDVLARSTDLVTFVGDQTRLLWPAEYDLRRTDLHRPTPVYPHSVLWRADNPHPALAALRAHLTSRPSQPDTWTPARLTPRARDRPPTPSRPAR